MERQSIHSMLVLAQIVEADVKVGFCYPLLGTAASKVDGLFAEVLTVIPFSDEFGECFHH